MTMALPADLAATAPAGNRRRTLGRAALCLAAVGLLAAAAGLLGDAGLRTDLAARTLPPSAAHLFGTDALGRDLLTRTIKSLGISLSVGLLAATISSAIALAMALAAVTLGRTVDAAVCLVIDMGLGLPHLMMLILFCFVLGGGADAVILAVALTHWPRLARVLRAELMQVLASDYVRLSRRFGKSWGFIARHHLAPHALPQWLVGLVLLFPHAILHEAALTFLGFGLEPLKPSVGTLLAESLRTLSAGHWWLGVFPGLGLIGMVLAFDGLASGLGAILTPREAQD